VKKLKHQLPFFKAEQSVARWLQRNGVACKHLRGNESCDVLGKNGTRIEVKFSRPRRCRKHLVWTFQLSRPRGKQATKVLDESNADVYVLVLRPAFLGRHRTFIVLPAPQRVHCVTVTPRTMLGKYKDAVGDWQLIREMETSRVHRKTNQVIVATAAEISRDHLSETPCPTIRGTAE
jgi:hypothetical protein